MEKKAIRIGKFNIVDIIAVVLLIAVVCYGAVRLLNKEDAVISTVPITYIVRAEDVPAEAYESCLAHLPSQIMDKTGLLNGWIESVEKKPYLVLGPDGQWVEDPDHVNLYFSCTGNVPDGPVMYTKIGEQEVRVGKPEYILKSEYIEFQRTTVVDVQWGE